MAKDNSNPPRKKGFSFLSLFLGILFGIIITVGAIVGCGALLVYTDLRTVFQVVGFNNEDENGNQYINTDKDNGGVSNLLDMITKLIGWAGNINNMTLEQVEEVLPVTNSIVGSLYNSFGDYVNRDKEVLLEDIKTTTFGNLGTLMQGLVDDMVPARLLSTVDLGEVTDNALMSTIMYGPEAKYIEGTSTPVWYNEYNKVDEEYILNGDADRMESSALSPELVEYLVRVGGEESTLYRLYYFTSGGKYFVASYDDETYTYNTTDLKFPHVRDAYDTCTGYYYKNENGETITLKIVTISTLSGTNGGDGMTALLDNVELLDMMGGEPDQLMLDILGGVTVGGIMSGSMAISDKVNELELTSLNLGVTIDSSIMMYIVYGVTNITAAPSTEPTDPTDPTDPTNPEGGTTTTADEAPIEVPDNYQYSATYEKKTILEDETTVSEMVTVFIDTAEDGSILSVYEYIDGKKVEIQATTVNTIGERIDSITIPAIVDVNINEPIMAYLGYSIYGVTPSDDPDSKYSHTAKYDLVITNDPAGDTEGDGTGEGTEPGGEAGPTDDPIGGGTDEGGEGGTGEGEGGESTPTEPTTTTVDAYVVTNDDGKILSVYYIDEEGNEVALKGTSTNAIGDIVGGVTENLTLADILDIATTDKMMAYLTFNITNIQAVTVTEGEEAPSYTHTAILELDDGSTVTAYLTTTKDEAGVNDLITTVYYLDAEGNKVYATATTINGVSNAVEDISIPAIVDIDPEQPIMVYLGYSIYSVRAVDPTTIPEDTELDYTYTGKYDVLDADGVTVLKTVTAYIQTSTTVTPAETDEGEPTSTTVVIGAYYLEEVVEETPPEGDTAGAAEGETEYKKVNIKGTTTNQIGDVIDKMTDKLALADFMDIVAPTSTDKNSIMMYMAYGVRSIVVKEIGTDPETGEPIWEITGEYVELPEETTGDTTGGEGEGAGGEGGTPDGETTTAEPVIVPVKITVDAEGLVDSVIVTDNTNLSEENKLKYPIGSYIDGTTINGVSRRVSTVSDNLTLSEFMDIEMPTAENKNAIMMYIAYGVRSIRVTTTGDGDTAVTTVTGEYVPLASDTSDGTDGSTPEGSEVVEPINVTITGTMSAEGKYIVYEVKETDGDRVFSGTTISDVSTRVSTVSDNLALADFMDVTAPTTDDKNAIMMYIAYGVRSIVVKNVGTEDEPIWEITGEYVELPEEATSDGTEGGGTTEGGEGEGTGETTIPAEPITVPVKIIANPITGNVDSVIVTDNTNLSEEDQLKYPIGSYIDGTTIGDVSRRVSTVSDNLALADFIDITAPTADDHNTIMMYIAYGISSIQVENTAGEGADPVWYITGLYNDISGEETICTPVVINATQSGLVDSVTALPNTVVGGIAEGTNITGTTIGDINSRIAGVTTTLTIQELMTIDESNTIMWALRNSTVNSLAGDISRLSIQEIYRDQIYVKASEDTTTEGGEGEETAPAKATAYEVVASAPEGSETQISFSVEYIYYTQDADGEYVLVNSGEELAAGAVRGKLTIDDFNNRGDTVYYTFGEAQGVWKFMLYETTITTDESGTSRSSTEMLYSVNQMGFLMTNTTINMSNATLTELKNAGIIDKGIELGEPILGDTGEDAKKLGDYTINELLERLTDTSGGGSTS